MGAGGRKPDTSQPIDLPSQAVSFDVDAFDELLNVHGVRLVHYKALRCPVGMTDLDDNRQPHQDHAGCSNGFLYYKAGTVTAFMQGNGNNQQGSDMGLFESSYITATFPRYYDQTQTQVTMAPFDRFFLDEQEHDAKVLVPTWHLQKTHETGVDKLNYPVVCVEKLVDLRGDEYVQDVDFTVQNGRIKWGSRRPGYQIEVDRGAIYSVRYSYRPYFYVSRLMHEIRVAQAETDTGRSLVRMPQQALLAREYTFTNEKADTLASESVRQTPSPADGGWGSR